MPQYQCPRCGYKCNQRNDLRKHFNRKKICHHIIADLSIEECFSRSLGEKPSPNKKKFLDASQMHPKLYTACYNVGCDVTYHVDNEGSRTGPRLN